jgi:PAS domain S-box-containing protein
MSGVGSVNLAEGDLAEGLKAVPRRALSLRWRLMLLVVAAVLPLLAFNLAYQYSEYHDDVAATGTRTLELAQGLSQLIAEELQSRIATLRTLALSRPLKAGNLVDFRAQAETVVAEQYPGYNIILLKENGQQVVNTILPPGEPLPVRPNLESLRQVFATGRPAVSNLYHGAVGSRPVVAIDVPVPGEDGKIAYVLSLNPRLEVFADVIRNQHLPEGWVISVFDRRGVNVARIPNGDQFVGHEAAPSIWGALQSGGAGVVESTSLEGIPLLTAFSHEERFGWVVAIGVPRAALTGPIVASATKTAIGAAIVLAAGLVFAWYAARRIAGPIGSLRQLAAASYHDALPVPVSTGLPEVDEVALALHTAETGRRRSRLTEAALRDGIETMPEGFVLYDDQDRLAICNEAYRRFYPETADKLVPGIGFEEILRLGIANGRFPAAKGHEEEWIAERVRRQHDVAGTIEQRLTDDRWVLVTKHRLPNGWVAGLRVDITAIKATQEALRSSEERLIRAQRIAHVGSITRDLKTGEAEWSDETYSIYGVTRDGFAPTTENTLRMIHPEDRAKLALSFAEGARGIAPAPSEFRIIRPDGSVRHVYRESEILTDAEGNPRYLAAALQDITERRRIEDQLRQAQKMEAIGNLTGGMAHDFNNLLGVIVGNLDLARELTDDRTDLRGLVDEALDAAWRGADLTRRLLAFARRQPLRPARIEVNELVGDAARLLRRLLGEDVEVSLELGSDIWPITADPAQLEASLANLATNARDAMPKGGRLIIATANRQLGEDYAAEHAEVTPGDYVMIEVSDTGAGMSQATMMQIFEPFFTTKEVGKGTGLGLSMVFGFLKQSGGHVNVYSELGVGTTFRLYLPRAFAESAVRETAEAEPLTRGAGEAVLVVEDNPGMRRVVLRQLRELGYRALECDSAAAAIELLQRDPVDLLLTDIVMPGGLDGVELARIARGRWPHLKIILTSGFPQARVDANGGGTLSLLSKPYRKEELAAALRTALEE